MGDEATRAVEAGGVGEVVGCVVVAVVDGTAVMFVVVVGLGAGVDLPAVCVVVVSGSGGCCCGDFASTFDLRPLLLVVLELLVVTVVVAVSDSLLSFPLWGFLRRLSFSFFAGGTVTC